MAILNGMSKINLNKWCYKTKSEGELQQKKSISNQIIKYVLVIKQATANDP